MGCETIGCITRVNLPFTSGRNAWKHNLTTLRSILSGGCIPASTRNNKIHLNLTPLAAGIMYKWSRKHYVHTRTSQKHEWSKVTLCRPNVLIIITYFRFCGQRYVCSLIGEAKSHGGTTLRAKSDVYDCLVIQKLRHNQLCTLRLLPGAVNHLHRAALKLPSVKRCKNFTR